MSSLHNHHTENILLPFFIKYLSVDITSSTLSLSLYGSGSNSAALRFSWLSCSCSVSQFFKILSVSSGKIVGPELRESEPRFAGVAESEDNNCNKRYRVIDIQIVFTEFKSARYFVRNKNSTEWI